MRRPCGLAGAQSGGGGDDLLATSASPGIVRAAFIAWFTLASAAFQFLLDIFGTFGGPDLGPASVVSGWLWFIGIGIALLIRPVSRARRATTVMPATAS